MIRVGTNLDTSCVLVLVFMYVNLLESLGVLIGDMVLVGNGGV